MKKRVILLPFMGLSLCGIGTATLVSCSCNARDSNLSDVFKITNIGPFFQLPSYDEIISKLYHDNPGAESLVDKDTVSISEYSPTGCILTTTLTTYRNSKLNITYNASYTILQLTDLIQDKDISSQHVVVGDDAKYHIFLYLSLLPDNNLPEWVFDQINFTPDPITVDTTSVTISAKIGSLLVDGTVSDILVSVDAN